MGKFFSRFKKDPVDPGVSSVGNMANFYSLLIFLIAIPFVLIIALVWVTGILGFNAYIFAGFACLLGYIVWRLYRRWGIIKAKMAAQTGDFQDLMREATAERQGRGNLPDERHFHPALRRGPQPDPGHPPRRGGPSPWPWPARSPLRARPRPWPPPPRLAAAGTPPGGTGGVHQAPGRRRHQPRGVRPHQGQPAATHVRLNTRACPHPGSPGRFISFVIEP